MTNPKMEKSKRSSKTNIHTLAIIAVLGAIEIVLSVTPLGYIPLGVTRATTIHVPVIIGAILLGPMAGGILGGIFGLTSFLSNTFTPTLTSFVFTPFYPLPGQNSGDLRSILICFVPRILIGVCAGYLFKLAKKISGKKNISFVYLVLIGIAGSLINTLLVMSGIYFFFGQTYSVAKGIEPSQLLTYIFGTVIAVNGILEAVTAGILVGAITKPLLKIIK